MHSFAILNTQVSLDPSKPENEYWNEELVGYIIKLDGKSSLRIVTSWGNIESLNTVGLRGEFHADQSGRYLGHGTVLGIVRGDLAEGLRSEGEIPGKKLSHWVFK